ncbi:MAG TPA: group II intron reverse transcriptase/maturase, partial [Planctomycetaceae bacterium]|nr:group II intron reverse transcriptase/maturase [Planctomycetaceae bacterium]
ANARLVRFADDFVIMARRIDERIVKWVEAKIEGWMGLVVNREKTKVFNAKESGKT